MASIAIFGGSFDPIHHGHLRMALELGEALQLDEVRLLPAYRSPLKRSALASSEQRLSMVRMAVADCEGIQVDDREIKAGQSIYSFDSLAAIRNESGEQVSLIWVMGTDSLLNFDRWHRWREFLSVANVLVVARPGFHLPSGGPVADWLVANQVSADELTQQPCGGIALVQQRLLPISATEIRKAVAAGQSAQFLLPDSVWDYIKRNGLYCSE